MNPDQKGCGNDLWQYYKVRRAESRLLPQYDDTRWVYGSCIDSVEHSYHIKVIQSQQVDKRMRVR